MPIVASSNASSGIAASTSTSRSSAGAGRTARLRAAVRMVRATRYVTPLREGGSLPGIVEADDDGLYVVKFRGAGQGPKALAAEIVAGGVAPGPGVPGAPLVLVELGPAPAAAAPDPANPGLISAAP